MKSIDEIPIQLALQESARIAGVVATYCDRTEHNEESDVSDLSLAARRLRNLASLLAETMNIDLVTAYADRLSQRETASPFEPLDSPPADEIRVARSWRDIQLAQLRHDRHYHADVFGMSRRDQLVHYSLHLTKLTAAIARLLDNDLTTTLEFAERRLPDLALFGVKLSTVIAEPLVDDPVPRRAEGATIPR